MEQPLTKSARTRQRILDAAAVVFSEQGYANARLSDIAERACMRTGSLYYHFDSREALVDEILRLGIETAWQQVREAVDALPDASPRDRLAAAVRAQVTAVLGISTYASAQARIVGQVPPDVAERHMAHQREYGAYWNELFEAAAAAGDIEGDTNLLVVRMLAFGAMNWTAEWFRPSAKVTVEEVADHAVTMILDGVAPRRP